MTILRGKIIVDDGETVSEKREGQFLPRELS